MQISQRRLSNYSELLSGCFFYAHFEVIMYEHQKILNKIERLVDQLPYRSVKIEVELKDQVLVLSKDKPAQCGFIKQG